MDERYANEQRNSYATRINVKESVRERIRDISRRDCIPVPTVIGIAMEEYVTARSTS